MSSIPVYRSRLSTNARSHNATKTENLPVATTQVGNNPRTECTYASNIGPTKGASEITRITSRLTAPTAASRAKSVNTKSTSKAVHATLERHNVLAEVAHRNNIKPATESEDNGKRKENQICAPLKTVLTKPVAQPRHQANSQTSVLLREALAVKTSQENRLGNTTSTSPLSSLCAIKWPGSSAAAGALPVKTLRPTAAASQYPAKAVTRRTSREVARARPEAIVNGTASTFGTKRRVRAETLNGQEKRGLVPIKVVDQSELEIEQVVLLLNINEPEARDWEDLDINDWDDPLMAPEYVHDICEYWKEAELRTTPKPDYDQIQPNLTWHHRSIAIDWMAQIHVHYNVLPETVFLSINVMDRFLSVRAIPLSRLQLVAVSSYLIASKYEETLTPSVSDMAVLLGDEGWEAQLISAERYILRAIDWDLGHPGPMGWLRRGSKADGNDPKARNVAKFLLEISYAEWRLLGEPPSLLAAASLWLARLILGREEWTPTLRHYMMYSEDDILPVASILITNILRPVEQPNIFRKYAQKRFYRCSTLVRVWASDRWTSGSSVDLHHHLDNLKAEARVMRLTEGEPL